MSTEHMLIKALYEAIVEGRKLCWLRALVPLSTIGRNEHQEN